MRILVLVLALALVACSDPTAPREDDCSCCAFVPLTGSRGESFELWGRFTPCPSDADLVATGWHKAPCPRELSR